MCMASGVYLRAFTLSQWGKSDYIKISYAGKGTPQDSWQDPVGLCPKYIGPKKIREIDRLGSK